MSTSQEPEVPLLGHVADASAKQPTIGYPLNWCVVPDKKPQTQPAPPSTSSGGSRAHGQNNNNNDERCIYTCCAVLFIIALCLFPYSIWGIITNRNYVPVTVRLNSFNVSSMAISNSTSRIITTGDYNNYTYVVADLNVKLSVKTLEDTMYFDPLTVWVKYRYVLLASTKIEGFRVKKYSQETLPTIDDLRVRARLDNVTADAMVKDLANDGALELRLIARGHILSNGVDCDMEIVCSDINIGFSNHTMMMNGNMTNEPSCKVRRH